MREKKEINFEVHLECNPDDEGWNNGSPKLRKVWRVITILMAIAMVLSHWITDDFFRIILSVVFFFLTVISYCLYKSVSPHKIDYGHSSWWDDCV